MKRILAALLLVVAGFVSADTTNNLVSGIAWTGPTTGTLPANRMPGSVLLYDSATGTVNWSYNQSTAAKTVAINNALQGTGIQVGGYNYTYDLRNMNGDDRQGSVDTMTVTTKMTSNTGATLLSNTNTHNTKFDWTTFTGTQSLTNPAGLNTLGNLSISFTSKDSGFWAGYFGPEVRNVGLSLNYTVDPCATNPAYSTTCANYNTVSISNNLFSGTTGAQAYAINTALASAGAGTMIHGFDYGYTYSADGRTCALWDIFNLCLTGYNYSSASVTTTLSNSAGVVGYTETNTHDGGNNGVSGTYTKSLRLSSSVAMSTLGTFSMTPTTSGNASITAMYSNAVYTPDPCTVNPLSSTSCAGYAQAYHDQQCAASPLYAVDCVGYAAAYFTQQCTANPLYNSGCPGYSTAYYNQQCSLSALYDNGCPGYSTAYYNQQCSLSALYDSGCPGYAVAYKDQQCRLNALYATDCPGYADAYKTQQCSINALYATDCPGYAVSYKAQQCGLSALYATDCPGYAQAYFSQQCALNGLYDRSCPNYGTAYAAKQLLDTPKTTTTATTSVVVISTESTATVTSNPAAVAISDPVVSAAVSTPSTTSSTSPTSVTSVINAPTNSATTAAATAATTPAPAPAPTAEAKQEAKKTEGAVAKAAARGNAAAAAKEAATSAANATTMEAQVATQGLVVGLMGYVPGFNAYQNAIVPDTLANAVARQYHKPTVDNRNAQRRLSGASELRWQEMVDSQYKLGN